MFANNRLSLVRKMVVNSTVRKHPGCTAVSRPKTAFQPLSAPYHSHRVKPGRAACRSMFQHWDNGLRQIKGPKLFLSTTTSESVQPCKLRVIFVNDVYELDNLPRFLTAVQARWFEGATVVCLPGDFVAPSLLSTLDYGRGMIDCMNRCKINYVCFGNHETDIPMEELGKRIRESKFSWINSNMPDLDIGVQLPEYEILEVRGGGQSRKVALLGLLSEDPGLYRPGSFNNATITPVIAAADRLQAKLYNEDQVDLVIPLTHQSIAEDRMMAKHFSAQSVDGGNANAFPLVIGAHDHDPFNEEVGGAQILKTGTEANNVGICDIKWRDPGSQQVDVKVWLEPIENFEPDAELQAVVGRHKAILKELDSAPLFLCEEEWTHGAVISSRNNRLQSTNLCTKLVSSLRDALGAECCMLNAGNIRGDADYPPDKAFFTYNDLKTEILFDCEMVSMPLPGRVIADAVTFSRAMSVRDPPEAHGKFLQICDSMTYDEETQTLTHIGGKPLDPDREYSCGLLFMLLTGLDDVPSLTQWARAHPEVMPRDACAELGRPAKLLLVDYFSKAIYYQLGAFEEIDKGGKGFLSREDIFEGVQRHFGAATAQICVDNIMRAADTDRDGRISKEEMLRVHLANAWARRDMDLNQDGFLQREEVEAFAKKMLGSSFEMQFVDEIFGEMACANARQLSPSAVERWIFENFDLTTVSVPGQTLERREIQAVQDRLPNAETGVGS